MASLDITQQMGEASSLKGNTVLFRRVKAARESAPESALLREAQRQRWKEEDPDGHWQAEVLEYLTWGTRRRLTYPGFSLVGGIPNPLLLLEGSRSSVHSASGRCLCPSTKVIFYILMKSFH